MGTDLAGAGVAVVRTRLRVEGIVQGVGYRPFVHALAAELGIGGFVGNDAVGVFIEAEGAPAAVEQFIAGLRQRAPALAVVSAVHAELLTPTGEAGFTIVPSPLGGPRGALVSADAATCPACLSEVLDPEDRRYGHAFTNCTGCGPRFTVVRDVPYDRARTTMAGFPMCADCAREYADPADRRFHAQPVCCPNCGPTLRLLRNDGFAVAGQPIAEAARLLLRGAVLAVKGLGGYHLAVDASNEDAVAVLRQRKHREDRPFAVMVADLDAARGLVYVEDVAAGLLSARARPIVLLPRRPEAAVAPAVAPGTRELGVLLAYTPLHVLLARRVDRPLVLTSGNRSDEPIAHDDGDARTRLAGIADAFLTHDRPIRTRTDDSVLRVVRGRPLPIRRSRGFVPEPLLLPAAARRPVLGCGAELKNTFCLAIGRHAVVSQHIGDLENWETFRSYTDGISHFRRLFEIEPAVVAHDLHPDYLSTAYAQDLDGVALVPVQHHHAHIASCLADNGRTGPVLGLALDGLGLGDDGTLWGGELLVVDLVGYSRIGHLLAVPLPGGAAAVREPWRMAASYLSAAYGPDMPPGLGVQRRNAGRWEAVSGLAPTALRTSSAGRLFDAVAALAGIRDAVSYEGQAAVELEQVLDPDERAAYPVEVAGGVLDPRELIRAVVDDVRTDVPAGRISARFHAGFAAGLVQLVEDGAGRTGLRTVALSGGVFQNAVLAARLADDLERRGFEVLVHTRVPPNDGGISLGQVAVAAARDAANRLPDVAPPSRAVRTSRCFSPRTLGQVPTPGSMPARRQLAQAPPDSPVGVPGTCAGPTPGSAS